MMVMLGVHRRDLVRILSYWTAKKMPDSYPINCQPVGQLRRAGLYAIDTPVVLFSAPEATWVSPPASGHAGYWVRSCNANTAEKSATPSSCKIRTTFRKGATFPAS